MHKQITKHHYFPVIMPPEQTVFTTQCSEGISNLLDEYTFI